jgi:RecB family exonuclease
MESFLHHVADYIYHKYEDKLKDITILMPNRRSSIFLTKEFINIAQRATYLPEIISLRDWVDDNSSLTKIEDVVSIFKLYNSFNDIYKNTNLSFDEFYFLGDILLKDFNDIDNEFVDANKLFINVNNEKELENFFDLDIDKTLKDYLNKLIKNINNSSITESYLKVWNNLYELYEHYRSNLVDEKLAYEGLQVRHFVENDIYNLKNVNEKIFFIVGFNFITKAEDKLFEKLKKDLKHEKDIHFIWEYDDEYLNNKIYSAGRQLSKLMNKFPMPEDFTVETNNLGNDFQKVKDKIQICSFTNEIEEAKYAASLLTHATEQYQAIILPDASLLPIALSSLPDDIKSVNITMNYSVRNTNAYTLIMQIFELYNDIRRENTKIFLSKHSWMELLYHPFIYRNNEVKKNINDFLSPNKNNNADTNDINDFIEVSINNDSESQLIKDLQNIITTADRDSFINSLMYLLTDIEEELKNDSENNSMILLEIEAIRNIYTKLYDINALFDQYNIDIKNIKFLISLITQILREGKIDLEGEPLENIQIMGLMESRLLDFEKVIILSLNNKIVPGDKYVPTFIPYHFRKHFGLPTPDWREGLDAFHIYRLLQHSEYIYLLSSKFVGGEECDQSPYLLQLKYRGVDINNFSEKIGKSSQVNIHEISKDNITNKVNDYLNNYGLSRHAISTYIQCPRKFYLQYIENLTDTKLFPDEYLQTELGNLLHQAMKELFFRFKNEEIKLDTLLFIKKQIDDECNKLLHDNVSIKELLLKEQLKNMLIKFFNVEIFSKSSHFPATIIDTEKKFYYSIDNVTLNGTIDLIIKNDKGIYIIDFKTGEDKKVNYSDINELFEQNAQMEYAFQLAFYCYLYCKNIEINTNVYGENIYFKKYNQAYQNELKKDKESVDFRQEIGFFHENLVQKIEELKNDDCFALTTDQKNCKYCDFQMICKRMGEMG